MHNTYKSFTHKNIIDDNYVVKKYQNFEYIKSKFYIAFYLLLTNIIVAFYMKLDSLFIQLSSFRNEFFI